MLFLAAIFFATPLFWRKQMEIKLAVFDFDGTLMDTRKPIVFAKQETMRILGLEVKDEETCASTIGLSAKLGFQKTYPELDDAMLDKCVDLYRKIFEEQKEITPPELFPGVKETLDKLMERKICCTVATSRNRKSLDYFLEKMELSKYFTYTLSGNDTPLLKPNPDPVLKTLEDLHFAPEETLVVGDMPMDILMGKNANTFACGVTYGNASRQTLQESGADFIIDTFPQLLDVIEEK